MCITTEEPEQETELILSSSSESEEEQEQEQEEDPKLPPEKLPFAFMRSHNAAYLKYYRAYKEIKPLIEQIKHKDIDDELWNKILESISTPVKDAKSLFRLLSDSFQSVMHHRMDHIKTPDPHLIRFRKLLTKMIRIAEDEA